MIEKEFARVDGTVYMVCRDGYVVNTETGHIIKPCKKKTGYFEVGLNYGGSVHYYTVHKLVAMYFVDKPDGAEEVNHIDGDKSNNCADNLEWVTHNENLKHAYETGLRKDDVSAKAVIATNIETGEEIEFSSIYKAARFFNISQGNICMCCKGMRPYANGYFWRYANE